MTGHRIFFFWFGVPHPPEQGWIVEGAREINYSFFSFTRAAGPGTRAAQANPGINHVRLDLHAHAGPVLPAHRAGALSPSTRTDDHHLYRLPLPIRRPHPPLVVGAAFELLMAVRKETITPRFTVSTSVDSAELLTFHKLLILNRINLEIYGIAVA